MSPERIERGRIVQMMPADGWFSVHVDTEEGEVDVAYAPLAAWVLVEYEGGDREIVGADADCASEVTAADTVMLRTDGALGFWEYVHRYTLDDPDRREGFEGRLRRYAEDLIRGDEYKTAFAREWQERNTTRRGGWGP